MRTAQPVVVPHTALSAEALKSVVESFVLREGTDYGERELALEDKVARVLRLLERGEARILYDPDSRSVDIVPVVGGRGEGGDGADGGCGPEAGSGPSTEPP